MRNCYVLGARVIDPATNFDQTADMYLEDGVIRAIKAHLKPEPGVPVIRGTGLVAGPGIVDMHVHLRDPGFPEKEDVHSAAQAAAAGGVTAMLAMPNTEPKMDTPALVTALLEKASALPVAVYTTACVTKGMQGEVLTDFAALKAAGAIALSDDGLPVRSTGNLVQALQRADELGLPFCAHCEDLSVTGAGIINEGAVSQKLGVFGVHRASEECDTARELAAAAAVGAAIHICHVSTGGAADLIRDAKKRGERVTAETAPHYLLLTEKALLLQDADYRMAPPLRTEADRKALIAAIKAGTIDVIATDHAPHTPAEKADFYKAPNGVIGMETALSATYTALKDKLPLLDIFRLMSTRPAEILGIPGGKLQVGAPGDIVLFDPAQQWLVNPDQLHGKSKNAVFKGMTLQGKVKMTICRGAVVYRDEE